MVSLCSNRRKNVDQLVDLASGDYRRAFKYMLPSLYYLSLLHSIVGRIKIRQHLIETEDDDGSMNKDGIPLTANSHGQMSTIHIDPKRGKEVVIIEDQPIRPIQVNHPCLLCLAEVLTNPGGDPMQEDVRSYRVHLPSGISSSTTAHI